MIPQAAAMVRTQIIPRGISDPWVLKAMSNVPRHLFVPEIYRHKAYDDEPLPIGENQTISQPYIVAYMSEALHLAGGEKILEIGTGSGYQTAILAELGCTVYTIERIPALAARAQQTLHELGYTSVFFLTADGTGGWPAAAPFNRILVAAASPDIPQPLLEQLAENGRMIIPIAEGQAQALTVIDRKHGAWYRERLAPVAFVPLIGAHGYAP